MLGGDVGLAAYRSSRLVPRCMTIQNRKPSLFPISKIWITHTVRIWHWYSYRMISNARSRKAAIKLQLTDIFALLTVGVKPEK
jgi:hypothetical protein